MQTKVAVGKEDDGKSIRLGVGDMLEVSLPETDARAAWRVEVDPEVLATISSPTATQTVWVLDEVEQVNLRTFRAARQGHTVLKMSYNSVETGAPVGSFTLEVTIGNAPKPKPIRQTTPAPQLAILLFEAMLIALAGAALAFRLSTVVADAINVKDQVKIGVGQGDLLFGLLGTVGLATIAGFLLVRVVGVILSRSR